jgi:hypothetical protein
MFTQEIPMQLVISGQAVYSFMDRHTLRTNRAKIRIVKKINKKRFGSFL